jgi:hypothetical protein
MNNMQAYKLFLTFVDDVEKIEILYNNLKQDIDGLSSAQFISQSRKILNALNKLNIIDVKDALNILKKHPVYAEFKREYNKINNKINDIKDFIYSQDIQGNKKPAEKKSKADIVRSKFDFLEKQIDSVDIETAIKDAKALEREVSRLDFEELPEGDYDDMVSIKNNLSKIINVYQGVEKSEKYGPYIEAPLIELIANNITLGNEEKAKAKAATILDFIEDPDRIDMFEPAMKRIIAKKMTAKEFKTFYDAVATQISSQNKFQSFKDYK